MPRTLETELQTLIDSGHCEEHTTLVLTLGDATVLRLATAELLIDGHTFAGVLGESDALSMSLTRATDRASLKVQNVDTLLGQQLLGTADALEGATAMLGMAFISDDVTVYHNDKMPGDMLTGAIDENEVELRFVGEIYGAQIVGESVSVVFPYEAPAAALLPNFTDPNDIPHGDPIRPRPPTGGGRIPDYPGGFLPT